MPATSSPSAGRPDTVAAMPGRFSISVPDRRGPSDPWFSIGTLDVTTTVFVVILGVASMLTWALEGPQHKVFFALLLDPDKVLDGQVWRIATWPQANDLSQGQAIWFVVTLVILWYFGSALERLLGRNQFAVFLVLIVVIPGIVGTLINLPQAGLRPVELCVFLVFVAEYPFARFVFNIPAWVFGAVILGIEVIQLLGDRNERGIIFLFSSLAVAAVTARTMGLLHELPWIPALPIGSRRSTSRRTKRSRGSSSSGGGEVVAGPWTTTGRSGPVRTPPSLPQPPAPPPSTTSDQVELDALLDKISAVGMDGLDADEKRRLNELSKRMRNRK